MRTLELYASLLATLSLAAAVLPLPAAGEDLPPEQRQQAMRLLEYEGLLGTPLPADAAVCMDDLLADRWPRADQPSPQQWQHMLRRAREAQEQCAAPPSETSRAAKAIRQAMEKQVAHQRALEAHLAQLRTCATLPPSAPVPAPCQALRRPDVTPPAQWERMARAIKLGQQ